MATSLSRDQMLSLFHSLNEELEAAGIRGKVDLAGGAVMCIAFDARASTREIDAVFQPSVAVLDAAHRVAARHGVREDWLNDAVKGYVSERGEFVSFLALSHLDVSVASPEYMLAMKCLAMRSGEGDHDEEDVRYLLRNLGISRLDDAKRILARFYDLESYPEPALLAVEEILAP